MIKGKLVRVLCAVLSISTATIVVAQDYAGRVVWVADGDTIGVVKNDVMQKIRISAIDAPEKQQAFGKLAKKGMASICAKRIAIVHPVDTDKYGRTVADVTCDGINTGEWMVANGLAWVYDQYAAQHGAYYDAQNRARTQHLGLWNDANPTPPWEWRKINNVGEHTYARSQRYASRYNNSYHNIYTTRREYRPRQHRMSFLF